MKFIIDFPRQKLNESEKQSTFMKGKYYEIGICTFMRINLSDTELLTLLGIMLTIGTLKHHSDKVI